MKTTILLCMFALGFAQRRPPAFPELNQNCEDDAGPRWLDDSEHFGNGFYWSSSDAKTVLNQDGTCPGPIAGACQTRANPLQAALEGPISCPTGGWFCRIFPDSNHGGNSRQGLMGDSNYGDCNVNSPNWEETNHDQSGHCHGSNEPSTFYWWVRDHWHRGYAGRLKCCCSAPGSKNNWEPAGVVNRCDYRAKVTVGADNCRDANEDHDGGRMGSGFLYGFEDGCPKNGDLLDFDKIYEPADEMCWEVLNFGELPDDFSGKDPTVTTTGPCSGPGSGTRGSCNGQGVFSGAQDVYQGGNSPDTPVTPPVVPPTPPTNGGNEEDKPEDSNGEVEDKPETEDEPETEDKPEIEDEPESEDNSEDEGETEDDKESEDENEVSFTVSSSSTCPEGTYVTSIEECFDAAEMLGYDPRRTISQENRPRGCYKTERGQVYFNRNIAGTDPSGTRYSICQTTGGETSIEQDLESRVLQSENGSCPSGTSYITTEEECEAAGELFDVEMRRVFDNAERVRGCYIFNERLYFNRNTEFTTTDTSRQSLCFSN